MPLSSWRLRDALYAAFCAVLAAIVCWSVFHQGLPTLRHDWHTPVVPTAYEPWLESLFQPWLSRGIGQPQPYPTFYLIGFVLWPFHALMDIRSALLLIVAAGAFACASAGIRLSRNFQIDGGAVAAAIVATLNPWVYSKLVAGHIFMVLAYGMALLLVAEITRERPRTAALVVLGALSITQIEFFLIIVLPFAFWCWHRGRLVPLVATIAAAIPIAVGIAAQFGALAKTPYILEWQRGQSVPPTQGALLLGYATNYASAFHALEPALTVLACIAVYSLIRSRSAIQRAIFVIALAALAWASGTRWLLAVPYSWVVQHVPESGVFRELYDLIAVVAAAYVVGIASIPKSAFNRYVLAIATLAAGLLAVPWITHPLSSFFVSARSVPATVFPPDTQHRLALFPALQPLSFHAMGSGNDPDLFLQARASTPINQIFPSYPVNAALGYEWFDGDTAMLRDLGVRYIISRRGFSTSWQTLEYQQALLRKVNHLPQNARLTAIAILSMSDGTPSVAALPQDLSSNSVFQESGMLPLVRLGAKDLAVRKHWIDAIFTEMTHPEWASPAGGIVTTSNVPITLPAGKFLLAAIQGRLASVGRTIASNTRGLQWLPLPGGAQTVRCFGTCMLSLVSEGAPKMRAQPTNWKPQKASWRTPWLVTTNASTSSRPRTLRFAERYDRYWIAFNSATVLPHVPLNAVLNAWIVPPGRSGNIVLIEYIAAIQFALELLTALFVAACTLFELTRARNGRAIRS